MTPIARCSVKIPDPKYKNDVLHPCIRYIEEGFYGHQWWMVQSPLYGGDESLENPLLFYGDSQPDGTPPLEWHFAAEVKGTPKQGYNSDPAICFDRGSLYVLWREFRTENTAAFGYNTAVYAVRYDPELKPHSETLLCGEASRLELTDVSPVVEKRGGLFALYTLYYQFVDQSGWSWFRKKGTRILRGLGCREVYKRTVGINVRRSLSLDEPFGIAELIPFRKRARLLPWHFDLIECDGRNLMLFYNLKSKNLYLARLDGDGVRFFRRPLLPKGTVSSTYKPTGIVQGHDLYLYYTDRSNPADRQQNELWRCRVGLAPYLKR